MIRSQDCLHLTYNRVLVVFFYFYIDLSPGFVTTFIWLLVVTGVMHETDDAYSIRSTCSCYWLDQFLTLALNTWISSKFSTFYWICLLFTFLILADAELPLCTVVTLSQNAITCFLESS